MSLKRLFDKLAVGYDSFNRTASAGLDGYWRKRSLGFLSRRGVLLDLGTGSGEIPGRVSSAVNNRSRIIGLDISPVMLNLARAKLRLRCPTVPPVWVRADARALPFRENSLAGCITAFTIRNMRDELLHIFSEVQRVITPGSDFIILEMGMPEHRFVRFFYDLYLRWIMPQVGRYYTGERGPFDYLRQTIEVFPAQDEVRGILVKAGFSQTRCQALTFGLARIFIGKKRATERNTPNR